MLASTINRGMLLATVATEAVGEPAEPYLGDALFSVSVLREKGELGFLGLD